jgi:hypothetical protein
MIWDRLRFAGLGCLVSVLGSCDVATVEQAPSSIAQNRCGANSDCPGGDCINSQCRSRAGTIQTVLLEVTPPADGTSIAGVQFLKPNITLPSADAPLTLDLDLVSQVVGRVIAGNHQCVPKFSNDIGGSFATADDSSIPAFVTLIPSETALGLYSPHSVVKSKLSSDSYFTFSVNVPPGDYDIYVEPGSQADDSCPAPPQLRRRQHLNGGSIGVKIQLPEPSTFEFRVSWPPADGALNGWFVDMLDQVSGRVLSNRVKLAISNNQKTEYAATLSYSPVVVGETSGVEAEELLRLSPPDGVTAPTVLLARSALGLFAANKGTLSNFTSLPTPIRLQGQVSAQLTPRPVASTVTLVATKIAGVDAGVLASFVRTAVVGDDGQFELDVLPGTYRVSAVPSVELDSLPASNPDPNLDSKLAETTQEWVVATSPGTQAGKLVTLRNALPINGNVRDASGNAVATALVQAVASPASLQSDVLHQALGEASFVPRASTASVLADGSFALRADSGTFDVTVRPLASTGFGWLVFPSVGVGTAPANSGGPNLGTQSIPLPVSYSGTVTTPGGTTGDKPSVPNALIRAYIYMSKGEYVSGPSKADSVLQVAETRANADGAFEILIPAAVNAPAPQ